MSYRPKWGKESTPPPNIPKNERVIVDDVKIERVTGDYGEQLAFTGKLRGVDYTAKSWVKYYTNPGTQSTLYTIALAVEKYFNEGFETIDDVIDAAYSIETWVFEVRDHSKPNDNGISYPRFKVIGPAPKQPDQAKVAPWKA